MVTILHTIQKMTLSKAIRFYNQLDACLRALVFVLPFLCARQAFAEGVPVSIAVESLKGSPLPLEVQLSRSEGFTSFVDAMPLPASFDGVISFNAKEEGVYHWRIISRSVDGESATGAKPAEVSAISSGSFLVFYGKGLKPDPLEISWSAVDGVSTYKLRLSNTTGEQKVFYSGKTSFVFFRLPEAFFVTVEPKTQPATNQKRSTHDSSVISRQTLGLVWNLPKKIADESSASLQNNTAEPVVFAKELEPLPAAPPAIDLERMTEERVSEADFESRTSEVVLSGYGGSEKIYAAKSSRGVVSRRPVSGLRGELRLVPVNGLELMARVAAHGTDAHFRSPEDVPAFDQNLNQYFAEAGIGLDTFFRNPNRRHRWTLEVRGALMSLPHFSSEIDVMTQRSLETSSVALVGIGSAYRWSVKRYSIGVEASQYMQSNDQGDNSNASVDEAGGFFSYDPLPGVSFRLGGLARLSRIKRCSEDEARCRAEGRASTRSVLRVGYFGLGYVVN